MDHVVEGHRHGTASTAESSADLGRVTVAADAREPGQRLRVVKFLAYGWSSQRSLPAVRDQVDGRARRGAAHRLGGPARRAARSTSTTSGNAPTSSSTATPELQQAVRFALFHVLQAGARAEQRAIPAKGLTGPGYDGHTFWDTETFVLPVLTYTAPARGGRRAALASLDPGPRPRARARELGLEGAAFPWRTIRGQECSGYWPAGTAAFHVDADIADAVVRYQAATGDEDFERDVGLELLVETARLWRSLGHHDAAGPLPHRRGHRARRVQRASPTTTSTRT